MALELSFLGAFSITVDGERAPRPRARSSEYLLALLTLRYPRTTDRPWLAATLWPESETLQAGYNLRRGLAELRRVLGSEAPRICAPTPRTVAIDLDGAICDLLDFDKLAAGDSAALRKCIQLYRGPLLEGWEEPWVLPERRKREELYLAALARLAAESEPAEAICCIRRAIAVDHTRESTHRRLMEALAAAGDYAALAEAYRDLRLLLQRQLHAEPSPATVALYRRLRSQARHPLPVEAHSIPASQSTPTGLPASPPMSVPLPRPLTSLVGRERECAEIKVSLQSARLLTLTGSAGVGKTRLAIAAAEEIVQDYPDGVCFVELAPLIGGAAVLPAIASGLGVKVDPGRKLEETLAEHLLGRSLLLILDNCEHLLEACAQSAHGLLASCPRLRILATSRQPLQVLGECVQRVEALALPPHSDSINSSAGGDCLSGLMGYESVRLFVERATWCEPEFRLDAANQEAVVRLCRRLEGIPLVIELAAAQVRGLAVQALADRLDQSCDLLSSGVTTSPSHHRTLRAALEWSDRLLSPNERILFQRLSVFAGGWTLADAEAICSHQTLAARDLIAGAEYVREIPEGDCLIEAPLRNNSLARSEIVSLLASLVERSLVTRQDAGAADGAGARYRMLEIVREYAKEKLDESGEGEPIRRRHCEYFRVLSLLVWRRQGGAWVPAVERLDRLFDERHNLRAALSWSVEMDPVRGLYLAMYLDPFWAWRDRLLEGCEWLERLLERARPAPAHLNARANCFHGGLRLRKGDLDRALELYERGLGLGRGCGDPDSIYLALEGLGRIHLARRNAYAAVSALEQCVALDCVALDKDVHNPITRARSRALLALAYHHANDSIRAREMTEKSLDLAREFRDDEGAVLALDHLGEIAEGDCNFELAARLFEEKLKVARTTGSHEAITHALCDLARIARRQGKLPESRATLLDALMTACAMRSASLQTLCLNHLALYDYQEGSLDQMESRCRESLVLAAEAGEMERIAATLRRFGLLAIKCKNIPRASCLLGAAERLQQEIGIVYGMEQEILVEAGRHLTLNAEDPASRAARDAGRAMTWEQAIAFALE